MSGATGAPAGPGEPAPEPGPAPDSLPLPATVDGLGGIALGRRPLHLAVGMFDGVHLGHQAVVEPAIHSARRCGGASGVLTFWPHPSRLLRPEKPSLLLMGREAKASLLHDLGADLVIFQPFDREFAATPAGDFVARLAGALPTLSALYVGENFRFGRGREGDVATLIRNAGARGIAVFSVERIKHNGLPISSTRIREGLREGDLAGVNALLGYTYFTEGTVKPGRQMGRQLGFPTLNLDGLPELPPRQGVYAVRASPAGGGPNPAGSIDAVANFGTRPTVEGAAAEPLLEVHLLGIEDTPWGAGSRLRVEWLEFIRPEQRFPSLDDLVAQIQTDCQRAREILAGE